MKLILIKIGKAFNVLKRDGLINGGRRISAALFALFKRAKKGDILFVTGGVGDSARYRTHNVAEELEQNGFKCGVIVQDNPFLAKYSKKYQVFIFHRTLFTSGIKKLIENIKKENKEIIFETDDLVYDPEYLQYMDYYKKMNSLEKKLYENGVGGEILKDPYVKNCTTTTTYLAQKLEEKNKKVFVVPNKLSLKDLDISEKILEQKESIRKKDSKLRIGYFSGTLSHNKDFAVATNALLQIMDKYSNVELFLVGPLDVDSKLNKFKSRVKQLPFVPRKGHFENIASVDINISPLEIGNPFCESKSELKFFEAGIVGVPTVASAARTFKEAIDDGIDGFVADGDDEWTEKIGRLIEDKHLRKTIGEKAREKALKQYSTKNTKNEKYYNYLRDKIK